MKVLVDINHPAHVHFFKNFIWEMQKLGHIVTIVASKKDVALELLDSYGFKYVNIGSYGKGILSKLINLIILDIKMLIIVMKTDPDLIMGISTIRGSHAGWLLRKKTFVFTDTEHAKEQLLLFVPFASKIFTPSCFSSKLGKKQFTYNGYQELAYLHPNWFKPSEDIFETLGIKPGEKYYIMRFISWNATHDIGKRGLSHEEKKELINFLSKTGKVFISHEGTLDPDLESYKVNVPITKIHDALRFASCYIGEGGTMANESAILGTPSILINPLNAGIFDELSNKYKLMKKYNTSAEAIKFIKENINILNREANKSNLRRLIGDKIDVTQEIIKIALNYKK